MGSTDPANSYLEIPESCSMYMYMYVLLLYSLHVYHIILPPSSSQTTHTTSTKQIPVLYGKRFSDLQEQLAVCAGLHDILHGLIRPILDWPRERY